VRRLLKRRRTKHLRNAAAILAVLEAEEVVASCTNARSGPPRLRTKHAQLVFADDGTIGVTVYRAKLRLVSG
jgi:putative heme degradation protein